jgi:xanthine dehydrogenase small subunit
VLGERKTTLEDFYIDYQVQDLRSGEYLASVRIPKPATGCILHSHKLSKRFDQDISAVCTAYRLHLEDGKVADFAMACGGLAAIVRRASQCEAALIGSDWNADAVERAAAALAEDFAPISDMRASAEYRLQAAQNLLRRFYLETTGAFEQTVYNYGR